MTRSAARRRDDRGLDGAINFDAALEAYLQRGDPEDLLCAAGLMVGSTIALNSEIADIVADLTGTADELADYDDAARAVRRWFATCAEPGARH